MKIIRNLSFFIGNILFSVGIPLEITIISYRGVLFEVSKNQTENLQNLKTNGFQ